MKKQTVSLIVTVVLMLTLMQRVYAITYLTWDKEFLGYAFWEVQYPEWNDSPNDDPDYNYGYIDGGVAYKQVYDGDGWDWSDVGFAQGKRIHASGYINDYPIGSYYATFEELQARSKPLYAKVKFLVWSPNSIGGGWGWIPWKSPSPHVAGYFVLVFFEYYYYDRYAGTWQWSNISNPDRWGSPDCLVIEMANRWYDDGFGWQQASDSDARFNFFTTSTTHDSDLHYIRCGWIVEPKAWFSATLDVQQMLYEAVAYAQFQYMQGNIHHYITQVRLVAFAVTVETYRASISGKTDYAYLYTP